jgi:hypothetical protein
MPNKCRIRRRRDRLSTAQTRQLGGARVADRHRANIEAFLRSLSGTWCASGPGANCGYGRSGAVRSLGRRRAAPFLALGPDPVDDEDAASLT